MGLLVDGVWQDHDRDIAGAGGTFARTKSAFRNWVTPDGAPGPSGTGGFAATLGRYHLYVALSCPWAHRTLIFRALKKLEGVVSLSIVSPQMRSGSWDFAEFPGVIADSVNGKATMPDIYLLACERLGVPPSHALALEDSASGVTAAKAVPTIRATRSRRPGSSAITAAPTDGTASVATSITW